jgi:hypothetical protein
MVNLHCGIRAVADFEENVPHICSSPHVVEHLSSICWKLRWRTPERDLASAVQVECEQPGRPPIAYSHTRLPKISGVCHPAPVHKVTPAFVTCGGSRPSPQPVLRLNLLHHLHCQFQRFNSFTLNVRQTQQLVYSTSDGDCQCRASARGFLPCMSGRQLWAESRNGYGFQRHYLISECDTGLLHSALACDFNRIQRQYAALTAQNIFARKFTDQPQ